MESHIDDAIRDFYVYLHKDKNAGTPFYVGKGTRRRAYTKNGRNIYWKEKVEELNNEYDVEIVKDNLTESEAYELETELIKKYGNKWEEGGLLVNQTEGGDIFDGDLTISIEFSFEDIRKNIEKVLEGKIEGFSELPQEVKDEYVDRLIESSEEPTDFKNITKDEQNDFINSVLSKLDEFKEQYKELIGEDDSGEEITETFLEGSLDNLFTTLSKSIKLYKRRKMSFRELATHFQDLIWDIESDVEKPDENEDEEILMLGQDVLSFFAPLLDNLIESTE